jgi:hypothetical protein
MLLLGTIFCRELTSYTSLLSVLDLVLLLAFGKNMIKGLVLVEGQNINEETLRSLSLGNAKQLIVGSASEFGVILDVTAETSTHLANALIDITQVSGVSGAMMLALRNLH